MKLVLPALCMILTAGCGWRSTSTRPLLREYRVVHPRRQIVQPAWLASFTTDEVGGRLSADRRELLYAGNQKGNLDIWIKDLTTGLPRRVTSHVATDTQPCWGPDGKRLAFVSMRKDVKGDIYLWEDGELSRLSDRTTEDSYPIFSVDGKALYFTSGPEGLGRIVRLDLGSKKITPITDWNATHPALSPDGRYLAYTRFDEQGRGRIAVKDLERDTVQVLTTPEYHAGFPSISADGGRVTFSRFTEGSPNAPLSEEAKASLWQVPLQRALKGGSPEEIMALARPMTSGRTTALFVQDTQSGLVFTTMRAGSLDIGMLPPDGPVPRLGSPREQLALALEQEHPRDKLLCLDLVVARGPGPETSTALYRKTIILRELGEFHRAAVILEDLVQASGLRHGEVAYLAQIDQAVLAAEQQQWSAERGGASPRAQAVQQAQQRLADLQLPKRPTKRVAAHLLLRLGDLQRLGGQVQSAIHSYEKLVQTYPGQRAHAVEAKFRLGELFAKLQEPGLLTRYYLTLFAQFPEQADWLRKAAQAILDLHALLTPSAQIEALRAVMDAGAADKPLLRARLLMRIGSLYEKMGKLDLAIQAMAQITGKPTPVRERTEAAFELGRLSLAQYEALKEQGRLSEALEFYDKALTAYDGVVKTFEPGHEHYSRARSEYLRLSLLMASQLEREGERVLAEKRYRKILEFDPQILQAHRKLMQFGARQGRSEQLQEEYEHRVDRDSGDFIGHYALGYLATLSTELDASRLDAAEKHLRRAVDLNPQSPFGHMTLGWIYEMRERLLRQTAKGWLEEAILLYDRAFGLNDAKVDVQTEADLLVNLCNAFANLGNGWTQAYSFCSKRHRLKLPFISKKTAAMYHLTFGRAASATEHYSVAHRQLERAQDLARELDDRGLEAEAVARMALNAHLQGELDRSNRLFDQAQKLLRELGQPLGLASLSRSVAYNHALKRRHHQVLEQIVLARQLIDRHGTRAIEAFKPIGGTGRTTAAYGFDAQDETHLALALRSRIYSERKSWPELIPLLKQRITNRKKALETRQDEELDRELLQLGNTLALAQLKIGLPQAAQTSLEQALTSVEAMQTDEESKAFTPDGDLFPLQVALALNAAEQILSDLDAGRSPPIELTRMLQRLQQLEDRRAAFVTEHQKPLLSPRLRLQLWSDLAQLSFHSGLRGTTAPPQKSGNKDQAAEKILERVMGQDNQLVQSVRLLRRVMRETDPRRPENLQPPDIDAVEAAEKRGTLEPLWRPLTAMERLRWHVLCGLTLAEIAATLTPRDRLEQHPTTELLKELTALGVKHELGALRFVAAAELSARRKDLRAMQAAVRGFLDRSPLLLERGYVDQADVLRRHIFERAMGLALSEKNIQAALSFAEQQERRAFVDDLVALGLRGWGRLSKPVAALQKSAQIYGRILARQNPGQQQDKQQAWRDKLASAERRVHQDLEAIKTSAPRVAALLSVPDFPYKDLQAALEPGDVAVTALKVGSKVILVSVLPGVDPATLSLEHSVSADKRAALIKKSLAELTKGSKRAYVDLGRIDPDLAPETLVDKMKVVRLATLWELLDARQVRNLAFKLDGLVAGSSVDKSQGFETLTDDRLILKKIDRPFEKAGLLLWSDPVRFDGGSAANARLLLHDPKKERLSDLRLARALGFHLRGHLLALAPPLHTPGNKRRERVALLRMAHAMGVPSVMIGRKNLAVALKQVSSQLDKTDLAGAVATSGQLSLFGYGGMTPDRAKAFAQDTLKKSAFAGVKAFNAKPRRLDEAVEHLEATLRYMEYLQDFTYQDGALEFLSQAYTLLEDYGRAVPLMERLLSVRQQAIDEAKKKNKGVLAAQAKWVKAVKNMAWLRMRNEQYDLALKANQQAIDLYIEVKRPSLAGASYDQRSIIAEKKGDMKLALSSAQRTLETAQDALKKNPKSTSAMAEVSSAAGRVARLQRMRFSNYRAAMTAARLSLDSLPEVKPEVLASLAEQIAKLRQQAKKLKAKSKKMAALEKTFKEISARQKGLKSALNGRVQAILEIARIQGARGDYNRAVQRAEQALALAREAKLPDQDAALLELVNNLYYTGAYSRALQQAGAGLEQARQAKQDLRQIQFYNARGTVYAALGRTDEATQELEAALAIAKRLNNPTEMAASHNNLGNALRLAGRFAPAKEQFFTALQIDRRQADKLGMAFDLANLGLTEELMGRTRDARDHLKQALGLSREIGAPLNELKALAGLGRMALAGGKAISAQEHFASGRSLAGKLGLRNWSWRFNLLTAKVMRKQGKAGRAEKWLREGLTIIEQRPPRIRRAPGAPKVEEEPEDLYRELVDLLAQQGQAEQAFDLAERMRARSMIDLVSQNVPNIPHEQARMQLTAIIGQQMTLEAARAGRMRATPGSKDRAAADQEIARIEKELSSAQQSLKRSFPRLVPLVAMDAWPYKRLVPLLDKHGSRLIVSYLVTQRSVVIWTLSGSALKMKRVELASDKLQTTIRRFRRALVQYHQVQDLSRELYRWLVKPVDNPDTADRWVVIPSGPLHILPFAALHDGKDYLVARKSLSYLASVNALRWWTDAATSSAGSVLSFGWAGTGQRPLSFAVREAEALARTYTNARVLQGKEATRAAFLSSAPSASLLHVATHATLDEQAPLGSSLELADGRLQVLQVLSLSLDASLVILSACDTGLGLLSGAESVLGLHQAFLAAGARRVISSLWRVSDLGTALLMKHLFRQLKRGDPATALTRAQNLLRERFAHPAFWAGFRLDGSP